MSTPVDRLKIYAECLEALPLDRVQLARILNLGQPVTKSHTNKISDKLNIAPARGVPMSEALGIQLLRLLHLIYKEKGLDISDIEFDPSGRITDRYVSSILRTLKKKENNKNTPS